ncbi:VWA domain-containing protein [Brevibacterium sp. 5221]|uniref:VWA domain-containing protein n=1 Tax=Brevibacterium rongguiense TaxID=2695267 RepID=A0A6N9H842_9MICO|nr:vWA domain-containing protein [Brevibacterium rongguiense]MYM20133.1 VWA domain-containing protein [Brevibacterium rongguiense]
MTAAVRRAVGLRVLALGCALALLAALAGLLAAPAPAAPTGGEKSGGGTLPEQFAACAAGGGKADVLLLVDESGSLKQTDPDHARVTSALHLVDQLHRGDHGAISVAVSGFSADYDRLLDWTDLKSDDGVESVRRAVNRLADKDSGPDTDYWTALDKGRAQLAAQAKQRGKGEQSCQAIVWLSDGELDFEQRSGGDRKPFAPDDDLGTEDGVKKAEAAAEKDLCRPGGVADQLRSSRVAMFGVGLGGKDGKKFDLMRSIATGKTSGGKACGKLVSPVPGEFYLASDIDALLKDFDAISGLGAKPVQQDHGVCVRKFCTEQAHTFVLDATTSDVDAFATASADGLQAALQGPDGTVVPLGAGDRGKEQKTTVSGVPVAYTWDTGRSLTFHVDGPAAGKDKWVGVWRLAYIAPSGDGAQAKSHTNLHITPGIKPTWPDASKREVHRGQDLRDVVFGLRTREGKAYDPAQIVGSGSFSVAFTDAAGKRSQITKTDDLKKLSSPVTWKTGDLALGDGSLDLTLDLTTAPAKDSTGKRVPGTKLGAVMASQTVAVKPPAHYPSVGSAADFGQAEGPVDLTAALGVDGEGCAWIEPGSTKVAAAPEGFEDVQVTSEAKDQGSCAKAGGQLSAALHSEHQGNGAINGTFTVMTAPAGGKGDPVPVEVAFTASVEKPLNTLNFVLVLIAALVLGPGIPLALLYGIKWFNARIPSAPRAAVRARVRVAGGAVERDGRRFAFEPGDMRNTVAVGPRGERRIDAAGLTIRTRTGLSPFGSGWAVLDAGDAASLSHAQPERSPARFPLALTNEWAVLRTPGMADDEAEVLVLLSGTADEATRHEIEDEISASGADLIRRLPSGQPQGPAQGEAPASPFGGPPQDPGAGGGPGGPSPFGGGAAPAAPAGGQAAPSPFGQPGSQPGPYGQPSQGSQPSQHGQSASQPGPYRQPTQGSQPGPYGQPSQPGQHGQPPQSPWGQPGPSGPPGPAGPQDRPGSQPGPFGQPPQSPWGQR